jgi:Tfp pilus assembly protein PilO
MLHKSTKILASVSLLIFIGSLAILGGFGYVIFKQKQQYIELYAQNTQLKDKGSSINTLIAELAATQEERAGLEDRILADEEVIDFLALIEAIGREQGVVLVTSSLNVQPVNATFETLVVRMEVEGAYTQVLRVLKLMENLPYQAIVNTVQLNVVDGSTWKGVYEVQLTKFKKI